MDYKEKYLKYKTKYLELKEKLNGGAVNAVFVQTKNTLLPIYRKIGFAFNAAYSLPVQPSGIFNPIIWSIQNPQLVNNILKPLYLLNLIYKSTMLPLNGAELLLVQNTLNSINKVYIIDYLNIIAKYMHGNITGANMHRPAAVNLFLDAIITRVIADRAAGIKNLYILCGKNYLGNALGSLETDLRARINNWETIHGQIGTELENLITMTIASYDNLNALNQANIIVNTGDDDLIFWTTAIAFSAFYTRLQEEHNVNLPLPANPASNVILVTNDKQRIHDAELPQAHHPHHPPPPPPPPPKNLFLELLKIQYINAVTINGDNGDIDGDTQNDREYIFTFVNNIFTNIKDRSRMSAPADVPRPTKYPLRSIGYNEANTWSTGRLLNNTVQSLDDMSQELQNYHLNQLQIPAPGTELFERFISLVKYLQLIYFNCNNNLPNNCSMSIPTINRFINNQI
jgi:hypothetical protein